MWDRRGACGNVSSGLDYSGTYRGNAETAKPKPKVARAAFLSRPKIYHEVATLLATALELGMVRVHDPAEAAG